MLSLSRESKIEMHWNELQTTSLPLSAIAVVSTLRKIYLDFQGQFSGLLTSTYLRENDQETDLEQ